MKTVIILDNDTSFIASIKQRQLIQEIPGIRIITETDVFKLIQEIKEHRPDLIVVASDTLRENVIDTQGVTLLQYSHSEDELNNCDISYPSFGVVYSSELLEGIQEYLDSVQEEEKDDPEEPVRRPEPAIDMSSRKEKNQRQENERQGKPEQEKAPAPIKKEDPRIAALEEETRKPRARSIAVYSSKGGVGKTTIACELASFLAMTENERENFRVCIADFNIDFADVLQQLGYSTHKPTMTLWAEDIDSRIESGETEESINYTAEQIGTFLQKREDIGLYALLGPLSNEDSMLISDKALRVMARNLIENAGFDFVIFDTGNNTRDSSFIPLQISDMVFVVVIQSVTTITDCNTVLTLLSKIQKEVDIDMTKFKLVINMEEPTRNTGIQVSAIKDFFKERRSETTKELLYSITECYGEINYNHDVKIAGNESKPLVLANPTHEFSRSIGGIVSKLVKREFVLPERKQKGFFAKLFGKRS